MLVQRPISDAQIRQIGIAMELLPQMNPTNIGGTFNQWIKTIQPQFRPAQVRMRK
jgi:hypothetical protein